MDALLLALQNVCSQLLPIVGALALIFLCILLKKVWTLINQITVTVKSLDPTIKLVDQSIEKVQAPLDTAVKVSHTVDQVHDKTVDSVNKAAQFVNENIDHLKDAMKPKEGVNHFETIVPDKDTLETPEEKPADTQTVKENIQK